MVRLFVHNFLFHSNVAETDYIKTKKINLFIVDFSVY